MTYIPVKLSSRIDGIENPRASALLANIASAKTASDINSALKAYDQVDSSSKAA